VPSGDLPVSISVYERTRIDNWKWFAAPPQSETYSYFESLLRVGVAQPLHKWDWKLELAQPSVLGLPNNAVSPVTAQGQLGLGATYYAANGNNTNAAAAFLKQGFLRYHFDGAGQNLRRGRFEYFEGQETQPKNAAIAWLQANRVAHRLICNFGFSNAQRSFDGVDGHYGSSTKTDWSQRVLWRAFAIGYHDGRTRFTKTDNRAPAVRSADHENIRIGTYGGDLLTSIPTGGGQFDFLFWAALQNGTWGTLKHSGNAVAVEGGYQFRQQSRTPWIRAGWFRGSGDYNATDNKHGTFLQLLPTPRIYARIPFYNLMNNTDEFVQVAEKPVGKLAMRGDLHWLQLTSGKDLWYQGGGAYDNNVFGYQGRPANGQTSFASLVDISADWQTTKNVALNFYYAHVWGKSAIEKVYPHDHNAQYGYVEMVYRFDVEQRGGKK
jgi:hypothetical protein